MPAPTTETCSRCGKTIPPSKQAYLHEGNVVCRTCDVQLDAEHAEPAAKGKPIPPATEKQKDYARSLGVEFPPDINRRDISALIDQALEREKQERLDRLDDLSDRESKAYREMRELILSELDGDDKPLSMATPGEMMEQLEGRDIGAILITFKGDDTPDVLDGKEGTNLSLNFTSGFFDEADMKKVLVKVGILMMGPEAKELIEQMKAYNAGLEKIAALTAKRIPPGL